MIEKSFHKTHIGNILFLGFYLLPIFQLATPTYYVIKKTLSCMFHLMLMLNYVMMDLYWILKLLSAFHRKEDLDQPWAKCGLFAAVALRLIFCGLIAAFCPENFAIMVCNILVICYKAPCVIWQIPWYNVRTMNTLLLARTVNFFDCQWKPWFKLMCCSAFYDQKYSNLPSQSPFYVDYKKYQL